MYKLIGTKWGDPTFGTPSGQINWQADLNGLDVPGTADVDDLVTSLNDAFNRWESVASVDFANGGGGVSIGIASFNGTDNAGAAAVAEWTLGGGSIQPQNAVITFNSDLPWAPTGSGGVDFFAVALHEIGHIIGLAHPSEADIFPDEIMNPVVRAEDLGNGDINGIQEIYGADPGDETAPDGEGPGGLTGPIGGGGGSDGGGGGGGAIGLIVGLLALVFGVFTGGAGAAVAMAAARVSGNGRSEDAAEDRHEHDHHDHDHHGVHQADGTVDYTHVTYVDLPEIDFDFDSFDNGEPDETEEEDFLFV